MIKLIFIFPSAIYLLTQLSSVADDYSLSVAIPFYAISLLLGVFWFWMLLDCSKRQFEQRGLWLALLILIGPLAAVVYFFEVKRKTIKPTAIPPVG